MTVATEMNHIFLDEFIFKVLFQHAFRPAGSMNEIFNRGQAIEQKNIRLVIFKHFIDSEHFFVLVMSADLLYQSRAKQKSHLVY